MCGGGPLLVGGPYLFSHMSSQRPLAKSLGTVPPVAPVPPAAPTALAEGALDTLAGLVRNLGEFVLPSEEPDAVSFRARAEAWANHVAIATPAPDAEAEVEVPSARRDWGGLRRFVRGYLQSSARHTELVVAD